MEASALTTASHSGLLARRSPLLRLQSDEGLVALIRDGHDRAFEVLFDRYQSRLLAFCRHLVGSVQDAEDVLQEVFVAAHAAMLADARPINARPWLYRIARNRCLNFLRRPVADGQDSMDVHPHANGATTLEQVQSREELRAIFADVHELPETQRTALLLREIDDLSYTEIAQTMATTLPSVKSLLVRARMSLAEASEARVLTCDEVRLELAEAAEGLCKASGPTRRHVRDCGRCRRYRRELRSSSKALGALAPFGLLSLLHKLVGVKLGGGSAATGSAGAGAGGAGTAGGAAAAAGGSGLGATAAGSVAGIGGALGAKAAVGMATAALITAGAVGVNDFHDANARNSIHPVAPTAAIQPTGQWQPILKSARHAASVTSVSDNQASAPAPAPAPTTPAPAPATTEPAPTPAETQPADTSTDPTTDPSATTVDGSASGDGTTTDPTPPPDPAPVPEPDPTPTPDPVTTTDPPPPDPSSSPPDDSTQYPTAAEPSAY